MQQEIKIKTAENCAYQNTACDHKIAFLLTGNSRCVTQDVT